MSEPGSEVARRASGLSTARARTALELAEDVVGVKRVRDQAEAIRAYAKNAGLGLDMQNEAARVKLDAERKAGAILTATDGLGSHGGDKRSSRSVRLGRLADFGLTKSQSSRWQQLAAIPDQAWAAFIDEQVAGRHELTTVAALRFAASLQRPAPPPAPLPLPTGVYDLILADPPWRYDHQSTPAMRAVENHYPTMGQDELRALPVPAAPACALFMWATAPKLAEAVALIDAWGFEFVTCAVWVKDRIGTGYWFRQRHELLLVAKRGAMSPPEPSARPDSVIEAPRGRHSEKPRTVYERLERMFPHATRLEMFARSPQPGWDAWGNEVAA